jgi:hypothetical protein
VSKRSYRRLAAVTGAALAIGSMAPAMAARVVDVNSAGGATASVETLDITDITGVLPTGQILPTNLVFGAASGILGTVGSVRTMVLADVANLVGDALCIPGGVLGAGLGLGAIADAGLGVGLGGVALDAAGLVTLPVALVGGVTNCVGDIVGHGLGAVGQVQTLAGGVVGTATVVAGGALGTATSLPGVVLGTAGGLLNPAGPLGSILNVQASGGANVIAGLLGSF